jgi:hypothetical protein
MSRKPGIVDRMSKNMQVRLNRIIPEKIHKALTATIKQMVRGVLFGSALALPKRKKSATLLEI